MHERQIFHLSIPVANLQEALHFYQRVLLAKPGRSTESWCDVLLWGHQITLQFRPAETLSLAQQGKRHFGVILGWEVWESERDRLQKSGITFLAEPEILLKGTPEEQAKMHLCDPSANIIEIKSYRNAEGTLGFSAMREQAT